MSNLKYVNVQIGTQNTDRFSHGNIYPIISMPFAMNYFTVQTAGNRYAWFYSPCDHSFEGIRLTHQPSPWVNDYGQLLFLPFTGELDKYPSDRWSGFDNASENFKPYELNVYLKRYFLTAKLVPTLRGAILKICSERNEKVKLAIMPYAKSLFEVKNNRLCGYTDAQFEWGFERIREYFYASFNGKIEKTTAIENGGLVLAFDTSEVEIRLATSFISQEQAKINHDSEVYKKSFSLLKRNAYKSWDELLSKINVQSKNTERKKLFYSSLYRAFLFPSTFYEENENGVFHFNADLNEVKSGYFYTNNGFWDTYRTTYAFLTMLVPKEVAKMMEGFVNFGEETGYLPKWLAPGEIGIMPGSLIEAVLADAIVKGILSDDLTKRAYKLLLKNAFVDAGKPWKQGRMYLQEYLDNGYVAYDKHECINNTLDNAYGDFCISQVAKLLGDNKNYEILLKRSKNYQFLFDKSVGFFRGKDKNGEFRNENFSPIYWGRDNCECSSWQNAFSVYHDLDGLATLYGGKEKMEEKLDKLFATPPLFEVGGYGKEIHEMTEMSAQDLGQCAISNQPSFHLPWVYSYLGKREKTAFHVKEIIEKAFSSTPCGYPGDEDNGSMACWVLFACLGFYPVCPSKDEFALSKPLFDEVWINGKKLTLPENKDTCTSKELF